MHFHYKLLFRHFFVRWHFDLIFDITFKIGLTLKIKKIAARAKPFVQGVCVPWFENNRSTPARILGSRAPK